MINEALIVTRRSVDRDNSNRDPSVSVSVAAAAAAVVFVEPRVARLSPVSQST